MRPKRRPLPDRATRGLSLVPEGTRERNEDLLFTSLEEGALARDLAEALAEEELANADLGAESEELDADDIGVRENAELAPKSSHLRRVRRRPARRAAPAPEIRWTPAMVGWRVALAAAVLGTFVALVVHGAASLVLAPGTPSIVSFVMSGFAVVATSYFLMTLWHAFRYRPIAAFPDAALPNVTVIVPAYNEGAAVRVALESALANDYPEEKITILAIDDGSKDDTWSHIQAVTDANPGRIIAIKQPQNGGKREALVTGFERSFASFDGEGAEFVVTVDSDSKLDPHAIRSIVAPMMADAEIAAVAGRVTVLNREANWLTRLLSARFYLTFDLARAAQSQFGAVLCTPGALSAYRASAVNAVLGRWSTQTFMGQPCTIAEDRALTTWLLREGYRSVYQRTAVVDTLMPTDLRRMGKMLVRWERGNIREDIVMLPLLATKWRKRDQWWPTLEILIELVQYPIAWVGLTLVAARLIQQPSSLLTVAALVVFSAIVQCLYCLRSERVSDFFFGVGYAMFAFVGLQWVFPYSLLTVRDGRWMTR